MTKTESTIVKYVKVKGKFCIPAHQAGAYPAFLSIKRLGVQ